MQKREIQTDKKKNGRDAQPVQIKETKHPTKTKKRRERYTPMHAVM